MAVDDDATALARIEQELLRRYGDDYRIVCETSAHAAMEGLRYMSDAGEEVVLVLAAQWLPEQPGSELLGAVRGLHPRAKRALLIDWGGWAHRPTADAILQAMALARIDYYILKPSRSRDEQFHRVVSEFLHEWSRESSSDAFEIVVVAEPGSRRAHEIRELLGRSGVPHGFQRTGSAGARELLDGVEADETRPLIRMRDGTTYVDPTNEEIADAFGVDTALADSDRDFDVIVVGAGPAGLSAAVYASSEGLETLVVERETVGGQAGASSLIRNYLGFSRGIGGGELAQRAYQQAWVFGARFLMMREAVSLSPGNGLHELTVPGIGTVRAPAIILALGVSYRRIGIEGLEGLVGSGVFYGASTVEARGLAGQHSYVVGGGNSAGQAALHLARSSDRVSLLVRGGALGQDMSRYLCDSIEAAPNIEVLLSTEVVGGGGAAGLEWLELRDNSTGEVERVPAAALFVLIGAHPRTDWLPDEILRDRSGYVLTGDAIGRSGAAAPQGAGPMMFETSVRGVFAVGDVRSGSMKRVAAAVGEGSVAIRQVHERLRSELGTREASLWQ
jgi:thioredoxin reductase (NADPH)